MTFVAPTTAIPRAVVGLDLSLTSTGLAVIREGSVPATTTFGKSGKSDATVVQRATRLATLTDQIVNEIDYYRPHLVVIESPAYANTGGHSHDRSGLWWLVVQMLLGRKFPVLEVPPTCRAKYATGKGNAGKHEVVIAVTRRYPEVEFGTDDEADALVLAAIGMRLFGVPIEPRIPETHLDALKTLHLPQEIT